MNYSKNLVRILVSTTVAMSALISFNTRDAFAQDRQPSPATQTTRSVGTAREPHRTDIVRWVRTQMLTCNQYKFESGISAAFAPELSVSVRRRVRPGAYRVSIGQQAVVVDYFRRTIESVNGPSYSLPTNMEGCPATVWLGPVNY